MFTGIIEEIGTLKGIDGLGKEKRLIVGCSQTLQGIKDGDSIAVNGACLTVTTFDTGSFTAHVSAETLSRTTLGSLASGDALNLERSMPAVGRFGGHIILGHVDCIAKIKRLEKTGDGIMMRVEVPTDYTAFIADKGSVALDGISLTSIDVRDKQFSVALVPFTLDGTTLGRKKAGDKLNFEVDIIARYLNRYLRSAERKQGGITLEKLMEGGF